MTPTLVPALRGQRQIWLRNQLSPASVAAYVKETFVEIDGPLDRARLAAALAAIVARQPALRADLVLHGRELRQRIHPPGAPRLAYHVAPAPSSDWRAVTAPLFDRFVSDFRFDRGALVEWHLIARGRDQHLLYWVAHHAVWDAHTSNLHVRALRDAYADGRVPSDASESYAALAADDAGYAASRDAEADARWFVERLPATTERARWLRAATDQDPDYAVAELRVRLDDDLVERVRGSLRALRAPPLAVLASAVLHLLRYFGRTDDQILALPFAGREHARSRTAYGCLVNTVLFHAAADPRLSFEQTVQRAASALAEVHHHQRAPLDQIYGALDPSYRTSGLPVVLNFKDLAFAELEAGGVVLRELEIAKRYMDYPLNINVLRAKAYELRIEYNRHEVEPRMAERLGDQLRHLLAICLARPRTPIHELAIDEAYSVELIGRANATAQAFEVDDASIFERVRALADQRGDAPAIHDAGDTWSAAQLVARAEAYADAIRGAGGAAGDRIAMLLGRSAEAIAAMLGILACGGVIVPLDPGAPAARIRGIFDECGVRIYIAAATISALHRDRPLARVAPGDGRPGRAPAIHHPDAYILYTSGSSGRPKGVIGTSRGLWNRLQWQWRVFPFAAGEVAAHKTGLFWVDSVAEIFAPLLAGVPVVVIRDHEVHDPHAFLDALAARAVTRIVLVPSLMRVLCEVPGVAEKLGALRLCTLSGEALTGELVARIRRVLPAVQILNLYGMTEAAGDSTAHLVADDAGAEVPLGRPLDNTHVHVLDDQLAPCPVGIPGEIFIGGAGLAVGYAGPPSAEHDRFRRVELPAAFGGGARLYRTGDLGAWTPAGALVYLGRKDRQLKIRGMRIDPAEIEHAARSLPGIRDAVAIAPAGRAGAIHVFYQAMRGAFVLPGVLEAHLRSMLPSAVMPSVFVKLDELPRLPNGKIDLAAVVAAAPPAPPVTATADGDTERALSAMWTRLLKIDPVPVDRTFFDLGGNSLLALEMAVAVEHSHGIRLGANRLVMRTIRELAREIAKAAS